MNDFSDFLIVLFFAIFGFIFYINSFTPWAKGETTEFFQWALLGIISFGIAAIFYAITDKK